MRLAQSPFSLLDVTFLAEIQDQFVLLGGLHAEYADADGESIALKNLSGLPVDFRRWRGAPRGAAAWKATLQAAWSQLKPHVGTGAAIVRPDRPRCLEPICITCEEWTGAMVPVVVGEDVLAFAVCGAVGTPMPTERIVAGATLLGRLACDHADKRRQLDRANEEILRHKSDQSARVRLLEAQTDPHFLFNMLNTVRGQALLEDAPLTAEIVEDLTDYLRKALRHRGAYASLAEEFRHAERYLILQKRRFAERLRWQTRLDPTLADIRVPRLLLQPLVENSIHHGVEPSRDGADLLIQAQPARDGGVCVDIADNGTGIDAARLSRLLQPADGVDADRWGLALLRERLQRAYGGEAQMTMNSRPGWGFWMQILLPKEPLRDA